MSPAKGLQPVALESRDGQALARQLRTAVQRQRRLAALAERLPAELDDAERLVAILRARLGLGEEPPDPELPAAVADVRARYRITEVSLRALEAAEPDPPAPAMPRGWPYEVPRERWGRNLAPDDPTPAPVVVHHDAGAPRTWPPARARRLVLAALPGRRGELVARLAPMPRGTIDPTLAALRLAGLVVKAEGYGGVWSRTPAGDREAQRLAL